MAVNSGRVEVYFDGDCPLCVREINLLRFMDRRKKIIFTDISAPNFDSAATGLTMHELMAEIHGRSADGTPIQGVEVFRQLYAAVGLAPVVFLTRVPLVSHSLELGYRWFAKNRLKLTGRCTKATCSVSPLGS